MAVPDFQSILAGLAHNGMTQADIARRLHVDPSTVCRIVSGDIRSPSFQIGTKIMTLHDKSLKSLLSTRNPIGCK
jgi:transcriptional regulator with XRE-family HTH domain